MVQGTGQQTFRDKIQNNINLTRTPSAQQPGELAAELIDRVHGIDQLLFSIVDEPLQLDRVRSVDETDVPLQHRIAHGFSPAEYAGFFDGRPPLWIGLRGGVDLVDHISILVRGLRDGRRGDCINMDDIFAELNDGLDKGCLAHACKIDQVSTAP
jgi:hypothetical protein